MNVKTLLDDKAMIDNLLRRMADRKPGIPAEKVKTFLTNVGREIDHSGGLTKDRIDELLGQLKNGDL